MPTAKAATGRLRFGFACIPLGLPQPVVRSCKLANASPARLRELIEANLGALDQCLDYAAGLGFSLFRMNSGLIPFASHPVNRLPWPRLYAGELGALGRKARRLGLRLSMHPGQYTVLNSPDSRIAANTEAELLYHANFMDAMGLPPSGKIVVHLGGVYGDKPAALSRLRTAWRGLPADIRRRLVLENDERLFSIYDALEAGEALDAPVVFDRFHHRVHGDPSGTPVARLLRRAAATWRTPDGRPKIHFSSQEPGARPGTHDVGIDAKEFSEFLDESRGQELDVMIEARGKEDAALSALKAARAAGRAS
jgi:UV DNA damage endonuclease